MMAAPARMDVPDSLTGEVLVAEGLIHAQDIDRALALQGQGRLSSTSPRLLAMLLCDLNLITPMDAYWVLEKYGKLLSLEQGLVRRKLLSAIQVEQLAREAKAADVPLISHVMEGEQVPRTEFQQLLMDLFHVPFRSISDIVFTSELKDELARILPGDQAAIHRMIPLGLEEQTLAFGLTAPENLAVLKEMDARLPQYRFQPLFIPFAGFTWFYRLLYGEGYVPRPAPAVEPVPEEKTREPDFGIELHRPEIQGDLIRDLYRRYEELRGGSADTGDRYSQFEQFICRSHANLVRDRGWTRVRFGLRRSPSGIDIIASSVQEAGPWHR